MVVMFRRSRAATFIQLFPTTILWRSQMMMFQRAMTVFLQRPQKNARKSLDGPSAIPGDSAATAERR